VVFDRHYFYDRFLNARARIEVQTLWSRPSIRVLLSDCLKGLSRYGTLSALTCSELVGSQNVIKLFVKIGEQVFQLPGQSSTFPVSDELANALRNAPDENVGIRLVTESGETVDSEIGSETIKAWETGYANSVSSTQFGIPDLRVLAFDL
jgi:hypothetical protein